MDSVKNSGIYVGIDIVGDTCMVSYFRNHMDEPETASFIPKTTVYEIPLTLAKSYGMSRWYQGRKATELIRKNQAKEVSDIFHLAMSQQKLEVEMEEYSGVELFTIFLRRLLVNPDYIPKDEPIVKLSICVPEVTQQIVDLFTTISSKIGLPDGHMVLIDHRESFYYYALSKDPSIYRHDIVLFEYANSKMKSTRLTRDTASRPQMVRLSSCEYDVLEEKKDRDFCRIIDKDFEGHVVSSVFLLGKGFEGEWMKDSLEKLCYNRRVFMGNNLYTKGAVYAGIAKDKKEEWPFVYIGDYEMKMNLSLKVVHHNEMQFVTLIDAGESWYETRGECEVILDGSAEFECWISRPNSRKADIQVLELKELPRRENRTTRLRIHATPVSDKQVNLEIKDLGFGEITPSSGMTWEHTIRLEDGDEAWEN